MFALNMRIRAIVCSLYFGIMPSFVYEKVCHYKDGWYAHMIRNLKQAWKWVTFRESAADREFEKNTNASWSINWFGGLVSFIPKRLIWCENKDCKIQFYPDGSFRLLFNKVGSVYQDALHSKCEDLTFVGGDL